MAGDRVRGSVELLQAFLWTCDDCGRDNFERAITRPLEGIEPGELLGRLGIDAELLQDLLDLSIGGDWTTGPERVKCRHCGAEFGTAPPGE